MLWVYVLELLLLTRKVTPIAPINRPCNKEEIVNKAPQVISCNEGAREVTVFQSVGGKTLGRSFHYDKVTNTLRTLSMCTYFSTRFTLFGECSFISSLML